METFYFSISADIRLIDEPNRPTRYTKFIIFAEAANMALNNSCRCDTKLT